jgi:hypothetical protein
LPRDLFQDLQVISAESEEVIPCSDDDLGVEGVDDDVGVVLDGLIFKNEYIEASRKIWKRRFGEILVTEAHSPTCTNHCTKVSYFQ